jgi:hypothetical protein
VEQRIDQAVLTQTLKAINKVDDAQRAAMLLRDPLSANLDVGEASLWAHALGRTDAWVLCGPDRRAFASG